MSYKELEVGYQGLRAASFYIGDESDQGATVTSTPGTILLQTEAGLGGDTLPTTYEYVYTSSNDPTRTKHPNCPICRLVSTFFFAGSYTFVCFSGLVFFCISVCLYIDMFYLIFFLFSFAFLFSFMLLRFVLFFLTMFPFYTYPKTFKNKSKAWVFYFWTSRYWTCPTVLYRLFALLVNKKVLFILIDSSFPLLFCDVASCNSLFSSPINNNLECLYTDRE